MFQIAVCGIAAAILAVQMKNIREEFGLYVILAASVFLSFAVLNRMGVFLQLMDFCEQYVPVDSGYLKIILKMIGITYLADIASNICKDSGHSALSGQILLVSRLTMLGISFPVIESLLKTIQEVLPY